MGLTQSIPPTREPITVDEVKSNSRISTGDEDYLIEEMYIPSARWLGEARTHRQFVTATWVLTLGAFPADRINLPRPPAAAVTSIQYVDNNGDPQVLNSSQYTLVKDGAYGYICPAFGVTWPSTRDVPNAVTVTYTAGYGAPSDVPAALRLAVAKLAATMYEQREAYTVEKLVSSPELDRIFHSFKVVEFY